MLIYSVDPTFSNHTEKKTKAIAVAEEMGSGSGSGSGSGPDNGGSGSGHQEHSGDWTSGSGQERPTNPTTAVPSGAGVDQEESGDESSSKEGSGKERQDESAGGESDDGSFEAWQPGRTETDLRTFVMSKTSKGLSLQVAEKVNINFHCLKDPTV